MDFQDDHEIDHGYELIKEKARRERILADRDQMELDLVRGNVVVRDDVHKAAFESSRKLRDSLHSMCKQLSPQLSSLTNPREIEDLLLDELNQRLEDYINSCA